MIPPPTEIDWNAIALWGGGIGTVLASIVIAVWRAITKAMSVAEGLPGPIRRTDTKVITTDSVAMEQLAQTIEANTVVLTENNVLRRDEHAGRDAIIAAVRENTKATEKLAEEMSGMRTELIISREVSRR